MAVYGSYWSYTVSIMEAGYLMALWQLPPIYSHFIYPPDPEYSYAQIRQASGKEQKTTTYFVGGYILACMLLIRFGL